ncbi:hypothetical protein DPMN_054142 [Dreissena polymorpha]|uniref:Uncharacterized protein n=1 Tax=Dreissena polymorpha TaxID=45954 RepID=A0A9D4CMN0_DREPO|nr:hypothetical protein DPMN_054142 [Dreissena polymorpha]
MNPIDMGEGIFDENGGGEGNNVGDLDSQIEKENQHHNEKMKKREERNLSEFK